MPKKATMSNKKKGGGKKSVGQSTTYTPTGRP
jgi:hypothetical protein